MSWNRTEKATTKKNADLVFAVGIGLLAGGIVALALPWWIVSIAGGVVAVAGVRLGRK